MSEPTVTRWRAFGRDRLVVNTDDDLLGWLDLFTGDMRIASSGLEPVVRAAVDAMVAMTSTPTGLVVNKAVLGAIPREQLMSGVILASETTDVS